MTRATLLLHIYLREYYWKGSKRYNNKIYNFMLYYTFYYTINIFYIIQINEY